MKLASTILTSTKSVKLMDTPELSKWAIYTHPTTPTYISCFPYTCALIGDAAHAQSPFQGSGAGQAIEDALILSHVLGLITSPSGIPAAFQAYDSVRRPRGDKAVRTSEEAGELIGLQEEMVERVGGLEGVGRELGGRMEWLWGADIGGMVGEVEGRFKQILGGQGVGET